MQGNVPLKGLLRKLLELLESEKIALINNDGRAITELVEKKLSLVNEMETLDKNNTATDEVVESLVEEINELQQINLLLTKQALEFQENLMDSIVSNIKADKITYSENGGYSKPKQSSGFVDQKV